MPFRNESIISTTLNSTNLTGSTIWSGNTNYASLKMPENRRLLAKHRTTTGDTAGTGNATETVYVNFSFPAGTFAVGDSIDIISFGLVISNNALNKTVQIRFGTANTTSDDLVSSLTTTTNTTVGFQSFTKIVFQTNTLIETITSGAIGLGTYYTANTANISSSISYISFTGTRNTPSADTILYRNIDIFHNRISNF